MALQFTCPKCSQKATLTSSQPGDWIECPGCDATVQVPGPTQAPPKPRSATTAPTRPAPVPARAPTRRSAPLELDDEPQSAWADKRVQVGAIAGGIGLLMAGLLVVALAVQKPKKVPEQAQAEPQTSQPATPTPTPAPTPQPKVEPPAPKPKEPAPKPKEPAPKPKEPDPEPELKVDPPAPGGPLPSLAILDRFGNPSDDNTGLAKQDEFRGQRLLFWSPHTGAGEMFFGPKNPLWKAWEDKGFVVRKEFGRFKPEWLNETEQLWILSTADEATLTAQRRLLPDVATARQLIRAQLNSLPANARKELADKFPKGKWDDIVELNVGDAAVTISPAFRLTDADYKAIVAFVKAGKGLCLLSDNDPFTYESNELGRRLLNVTVRGNYQGEKIAYVRERNLDNAQVQKYKGDYPVPDHPLLTGVNFVYEGITISHPSASKLEVALPASTGQPVIAVSKEPGLRVIIDCGFTRYCHGPNDDVSFILMTAGTTRLAQNMAAYLAGKTEAKKK